MIVVSNAGPLIALGKLGQLGLLIKLYGQVLIPRAVYEEVVLNGLRMGAPDARAVDFLVRTGDVQVVDVPLPDPLPKTDFAHRFPAGTENRYEYAWGTFQNSK